MSIRIQNAEPGQIVWSDVEALVQTKATETARLEFKRSLSHPKGEPDGWYQGRDIGRAAKEAIGAEVVAFANAYGGILILGVDEDRQKPPTATDLVRLPRLHELAEKLTRYMDSAIDPPIDGLGVQAVEDPNQPDTGVLIIRIPGSLVAPHGVGLPPVAYVRRGTSCTPMTMRDIQTRFWEARTGIARIEGLREESRQRLELFKGKLVESEKPLAVIFRCSAIAGQRLDLSPIDYRKNWLLNLCPGPGQFGIGHSAASTPGSYTGWIPRAHGAFTRTYDERAVWNVTDDGTVAVEGVSFSDKGQHDPEWYFAIALQVVTAAIRLRMRAGRPDVPIHLDLNFHLGDQVTRWTHPGFVSAKPLPTSAIGPFSLLRLAELPDVMAAAKREVYGGFASEPRGVTSLDLQHLFEDWGRINT